MYRGVILAIKKIWNLKYVAGNPKMFTKVTMAAGSPMTRSEAMDGAQTIGANGWRVWVEHAKTAKHIFESDAEKSYTVAQEQQTK